MTFSKKARGRRVASDEAHAWARSLPLNNPNAKTVLRALALYVNGEGCCFVGLDQLSEDTDLSADTVRRRMVWLEQVGAIVRLPQWLDANGVRNGEGRGKRTTDEVRLLLQADADEIEARAKGDESVESSAISSTETTAFSPSSQQGLNSDGETLSPQLAPRQPLQSCDHLTSEPEPENPPEPPSGGSVDIEGWKEFQEDWSEPILRQSLAQQEFARLAPEDRLFARKAARGYVAWRKAQRKPPNVLGAHLFLRERDAWAGFAARAPDAGMVSSIPSYDVSSPEARALLALCDLARGRLQQRASRVFYANEVTPQILAFADLANGLRPLWTEDHEQIGAWRRFLASHDFGNRGDIVQSRGLGADQRKGIWVPHPWPPRVDGTWSPAGLSDDDVENFK